MTKEVIGIRDAFDAARLVTEKPEGLYDEIITGRRDSPARCARLKRRASGDRRADRRNDRAAGEGDIGGDWPLEDARDDLQRFIGR